MKLSKPFSRKTIVILLLALAVFTTMGCEGITPGDALGIACAVDPNSSHCQ